MARAKVLTVKSADIMRLEGLAQELVDIDPQFRPKSETVDYIAQHLGVRRRVVQDWLRLARPATLRNDTAGAFMDVSDRIAKLLSERTYAEIHKMVVAGERDAFKAAMWLLPRIDPDRFDPTLQGADEDDTDDVFDTSGVAQEVFDAMTDDERERMAELRQQVLHAMDAYEVLVKTVQGRVLAEELAERQGVRAP